MSSALQKIDPAWAWAPFRPDGKRSWDRRLAAHLYRRAGFAASPQQLDQAAASSPGEIVQQMMKPGGIESFRQEMDRLGRTLLSGGDSRGLAAWWLYRMLHTPAQLLEKTTLFWHGHFATSADKVNNARLMLQQNAMLRGHALGNFVELVKLVSRDPAMLIYLDSTTNRKTHPNENYARELLELFCLGLDNYSEKDIQEIARCFTGWEVRRQQFRFNKYQHDKGEKQFFGERGAFGGDQAVDIVMAQPAASQFIARKLVGYFLFDEPVPPTRLIKPLADQLRTNGFVIGPVIQRILTSQLMYSSSVVGRKVRSPIEMAIGVLRALQGTTNVTRLTSDLNALGQVPFFPPNVKGWEGGRSWINSSTSLGRINLVRRLISAKETKFAGGGLGELVRSQAGSSPGDQVDWMLELLVAVPPPRTARDALTRLLETTGGDNDRRIGAVMQAIAALPEFQLS